MTISAVAGKLFDKNLLKLSKRVFEPDPQTAQKQRVYLLQITSDYGHEIGV